MTRARALMAAVPQRVWMAVASLVVLASVGVSLVLGAGLSTWRGEVGHSAAPGVARPGTTVIAPPKSSVIVVPTPVVHHPAPAAPATGTGSTHATSVTRPALPHTAAAAAPPAAAAPAAVAAPRTARPEATAPSEQSCTPPVRLHRGRGHAYGLFKKAFRALDAHGCGPVPKAMPGRGKAKGAGNPHGH